MYALFMKIRILKKSEEGQWDDFVRSHSFGNLSQESKWGKFQASVKSRGKYWIFAVFETDDKGNEKKIIAGSLVIRHLLPKGLSWLYASRGPLFDYSKFNKNKKDLFLTSQKLFSEMSKLAKKENSIFLRIDPNLDKSDEIDFSSIGCRFIKSGFYPQDTLLVDLNPSEDEILAQMKQKGRYNIRLANKKGVEIEKVQNADIEKYINDFYELLLETTKRDGFSGHGKDYYLDMLGILGGAAALYVAKFEGKVLAAAIITYFDETATYYYGVSGNHMRNLMAPYLLHWKIMQDSKKAGYKYYDLFGIAANGAEKGHAWEGVTNFKRKFGGIEKSYARPQEFAFNKFLYLLYRFYKWIR